MGRGTRRVHDVDPFTELSKLMDNEGMLTLCSLNKQGINMLGFLLKSGNVYDDMFLIPMEDYLAEAKVKSAKSFYLSIDNLIKWDLIAKSKEVNFYYINTKFFPNVNL